MTTEQILTAIGAAIDKWEQWEEITVCQIWRTATVGWWMTEYRNKKGMHIDMNSGRFDRWTDMIAAALKPLDWSYSVHIAKPRPGVLLIWWAGKDHQPHYATLYPQRTITEAAV